MTILLQDEWFDLGCGCEASKLGGLLVSSRCRAHRVLIPEDDLRCILASWGGRNITYGPIDVDLETLAKGGDAPRERTLNRRVPTARA